MRDAESYAREFRGRFLEELKKFIRWALTAGQADGPKLLFSPLPKVVLKASLRTLPLIHT